MSGQGKLSDFWKPVKVTNAVNTVTWEHDKEKGLLIATNGDLPQSINRIAAFDLDHTLIKPKGKRKFAQSEADWTFLYPEIPRRLKALSKEPGVLLVIFSNQRGLEDSPEETQIFKEKLNDLFGKLAPAKIILLAALKQNLYRKPRIGMWSHLLSLLHLDDSEELHRASFYVGDAAGRLPGWKQGAPQDFAASDRKFALNAGLRFMSPEEFFLDCPAAEFHLGMDPKDLQRLNQSIKPRERPVQKELVLFVGPPSSGKSTFFARHYAPLGHVRVNQDELRSRQACFKALQEHMAAGLNTVIDNTNATKASRRAFIEAAHEHGYAVRAVYFQIARELSDHLNHFRALTSGAYLVPKVAYNTYWKAIEPPSLEEGFSHVEIVPFSLELPDSDLETTSLFFQYLS